MRAGAHARPLGVVLVAALAAALLLAGCGKKSSLEPPPDKEASFTYPRDYPAPLPGTQPRGPQPREESERLRVSPFPDDYTSPTKTY